MLETSFCCWQAAKHFEKRPCGFAGMAFSMRQYIELTFGHAKVDLLQKASFKAGAATDAEITTAPRPASAAERTASFEGNSKAMRSAALRPNSASASSNTDLVPDPRSRSTHSTSMRSVGVMGLRLTSG